MDEDKEVKANDTAVTKYINDKLGEICGDYHDKIEDKVLVDDNGIPVL